MFAMHRKLRVGIDIGTHSIKGVRLKQGGKGYRWPTLVLCHCDRKPLSTATLPRLTLVSRPFATSCGWKNQSTRGRRRDLLIGGDRQTDPRPTNDGERTKHVEDLHTAFSIDHIAPLRATLPAAPEYVCAAGQRETSQAARPYGGMGTERRYGCRGRERTLSARTGLLLLWKIGAGWARWFAEAVLRPLMMGQEDGVHTSYARRGRFRRYFLLVRTSATRGRQRPGSLTHAAIHLRENTICPESPFSPPIKFPLA
jgi:hypothetical protein